MICLALSANLRVEIVSLMWLLMELTAAIKVVFVLPPSESCKSLVILDSLYGMCSFYFPYARAEMTLPREERLRLIVFSSLKCAPVMASSLWIFSLPAKSQRLSFPRKSMPRSSAVSLSTNIWKIVWDLEEWMFALVYRVIRLASPRFKRMKQSLTFVTTYSLWPSTKMPVYLSSRIFKALFESLSWNRSKSFSL